MCHGVRRPRGAEDTSHHGQIFLLGNLGETILCLGRSFSQGLGRPRWAPSSQQGVSSRQVFHDVAYKAKNRADLVAGIDEFLDQVTVLPPGEWDPSIRIEPPKNVPSQVGAAVERGARGRGGGQHSRGCVRVPVPG